MKKSILLDLPMPIKTPRLLIQSPRVGDGVFLNEAILESFEKLHKYMEWAKKKPTLSDSEEFVRLSAANWILKKSEDPWLPIFIFDKIKNKFIGASSLYNIDWEIPSAETGYWVRDSCERQGFITEAVNAITQYAFKELKVNRLSIKCDKDNQRSRNIPENLGYQLEAVTKNDRRNPLSNELSDTFSYVRYDLSGLPNLQVTW